MEVKLYERGNEMNVMMGKEMDIKQCARGKGLDVKLCKKGKEMGQVLLMEKRNGCQFCDMEINGIQAVCQRKEWSV